MNLSNYSTLIKNFDEGYDIVINSNADRDLAPKGKASITIITSANYHDFPERGTKEYSLRLRRHERTLRFASQTSDPNGCV